MCSVAKTPTNKQHFSDFTFQILLKDPEFHPLVSPKSPQVAAPIFPGFWIPGLCYTLPITRIVISSTFFGLFPWPNPSLRRVSHKEWGEQDDFQFGYKKLSGIRKLLSISCQKGE